jgi:hypothetical protein
MNLFLYIPPTSAHPPGVLKSIVYGNLQRYWQQNTHSKDFIEIARKFYQRLISRGHSHNSVRELFTEAAAAIDRAIGRHTSSESRRADPRNTLFYHLEYHPRGLTRHTIRVEYNFTGCVNESGFSRLIIAFSRPRNLRDALMQTKLEEPDGSRASDIFNSIPTEV